mgnify:CR=1 FL=1
MRQGFLALVCFLLLTIPSPKLSQTDAGAQPTEAPQDIEVVYSRAPEGVSQELWDWLTEEDARDEAAKQSKQIAPRLESYQKTIDELIN